MNTGMNMVRDTRDTRRYHYFSLICSFAALGVSIYALCINQSDRKINERMINDKGKITAIINLEAQAVVDRDFGAILAKYDTDAVVKDVGGGQVSNQNTWIGKERIASRYFNLARFNHLKHLGTVVTMDELGNYAQASAGTEGQYEDTSGKVYNIYSVTGERWTFKKVNGDWLITSFCYNVP